MAKLAFLLTAYMASGALANNPTACASITDCAFDEQCVDGVCVEGTPASSNGPPPENPIVVCTEDDCRFVENLIYNSNLGVTPTTPSPGYGAGRMFDGWNAAGRAGVAWSPLVRPGPGAKKNEVSIRSKWGDDGAFATDVEITRPGEYILQFQMADPQDHGFCWEPTSLILYVDVSKHPSMRYCVCQRQRPTQKKIFLHMSAGTYKISFRGLQEHRDCCSASIRNVQFYRNATGEKDLSASPVS